MKRSLVLLATPFLSLACSVQSYSRSSEVVPPPTLPAFELRGEESETLMRLFVDNGLPATVQMHASSELWRVKWACTSTSAQDGTTCVLTNLQSHNGEPVGLEPIELTGKQAENFVATIAKLGMFGQNSLYQTTTWNYVAGCQRTPAIDGSFCEIQEQAPRPR